MATGTPARQRLLDAAARVFYAEGIHTVGVDRIVTEAGVTRATFYHHFPSKEDLVRTYLSERDHRVRARVAAAAPEPADPKAVLAVLVNSIGDDICAPGFRGCAFINAAAEYPDPAHPVARVVAEHREWFRTTLAEAFARAGCPDPAGLAAVVFMLRDGAMVGGYLDDADTVRATLTRAIDDLVNL